jgi:flagellar biogenesis protein FliO
MNTEKLNLLVEQKLQVFENLEELNTSSNWETNLNSKLLYAKPKSNLSMKYSLIIALLIIINASFILFSVVKKQNTSSSRTQDLKVITNEILISQNN